MIRWVIQTSGKVVLKSSSSFAFGRAVLYLFLFFVVVLAERNNEKPLNQKYLAAAGYKAEGLPKVKRGSIAANTARHLFGKQVRHTKNGRPGIGPEVPAVAAARSGACGMAGRMDRRIAGWCGAVAANDRPGGLPYHRRGI
jgi:hypothetical protein